MLTILNSIIAVTGLAGHAFGSWRSRDGSCMWLRDFLPTSIPNARIITYGYDTKLPGSQSTATILELSKKLLESVKVIRHHAMVGHKNATLEQELKFQRTDRSYSLAIV